MTNLHETQEQVTIADEHKRHLSLAEVKKQRFELGILERELFKENDLPKNVWVSAG